MPRRGDPSSSSSSVAAATPDDDGAVPDPPPPLRPRRPLRQSSNPTLDPPPQPEGAIPSGSGSAQFSSSPNSADAMFSGGAGGSSNESASGAGSSRSAWPTTSTAASGSNEPFFSAVLSSEGQGASSVSHPPSEPSTYHADPTPTLASTSTSPVPPTGTTFPTTAQVRYTRPAQRSPPPPPSSSLPSAVSERERTVSPTPSPSSSNPYASHYSNVSSPSRSSLSSRRSSAGSSGDRPAMTFTLDLSSAAAVTPSPDPSSIASNSHPNPLLPSELEAEAIQSRTSADGAFIDTPIPGQRDAQRSASSYNYFSSNRVGVDEDEGEGDGSGANVPQEMMEMMNLEEDENLGYLEKIYLFAKSQAVFHRVFIARALPTYLPQVSPAEAVEYVLPLLNGLGTDQDESVKEAFVAELVGVMWWFFVNCELVEMIDGDYAPEQEVVEQEQVDAETDADTYHTAPSESEPTASPRPQFLINSFTPLLGSLLLSSNALVSEIARNSVVELLRRAVTNDTSVAGGGIVSEAERLMLIRELVEGVVIALARLGMSSAYEEEIGEEELEQQLQQEDFSLVEQEDEDKTPTMPQTATAVQDAEPQAPPSHIDIPPEISTSSPTPSPPDSDSTALANSDVAFAASPSAGRVISPGASIHSTSTDRSTPSLSAGNSLSSESEYSLETSSSSPSNAGDVVVRNPFDIAAERQLASRGPDDWLFRGGETDDGSSGGIDDFGIYPSARAFSPISPSSPSASSAVRPGPPSNPDSASSGGSASSAGTAIMTTSYSEFKAAAENTHLDESLNDPPRIRLGGSPAVSDDGAITPRVEKNAFHFTPSTGPTSSQMARGPLNPPAVGPEQISPPLNQPVPTPTSALAQSILAESRLTASPGIIGSTSDSPSVPVSDSAPMSTTLAPIPEASPPLDVPAATAAGTNHDSRPVAPTTRSESEPMPSTAGTATTPTNPDDPVKEEAAVGAVASMSLIASIAASGFIPEDAKGMFVAEVARVGMDTTHWVRREAAYALGALSKVVDEEMLLDYLVPLYQTFIDDSAWQVRQSAVFALPPILGRLSWDQRAEFALDNYKILMRDKSRSVRLAALEILGEIIHGFAQDPAGPPAELLQIFIGKPSAEYRLAPPPAPTAPPLRAHSAPSTPGVNERPKSKRGLLARDPSTHPLVIPPPDPETSGIDPVPDYDRPLICAFNFPAIALTLGPGRWHEVSAYYGELARDYGSSVAHLKAGTPEPLSLSSSSSSTPFGGLAPHTRQQNQKKLIRVRRTLAASLGEMARILGPDIARTDLMPVFWEALYSKAAPPQTMSYGFMGTSFATVSAVGVAAHNLNAEADAEDARTKMLDCLVLFVESLAPAERVVVGKGLEAAWVEHVRGWREREVFARTFGGLSGPLGGTESGAEVVRKLIMLAVSDNVAAVRDEAVVQLPKCFNGLVASSSTAQVKLLREDIYELAKSSSFRRRATFVKCVQSMVLSETLGKQELKEAELWPTLALLSKDSIADVRIGTARLVSLIAYQHYPHRNYPSKLMALIRTLRDDPTPEVSSFVRFLIVTLPQPTPLPMVLPVLQPHAVSPFATFSNPPFFGDPVPSASTDGGEEYFDALDFESLEDSMANDDASTTPGEANGIFEALGAMSPSSSASSSNSADPSDSDAETITPTLSPQRTGSGETEPPPARAERPPIYRLWSY